MIYGAMIQSIALEQIVDVFMRCRFQFIVPSFFDEIRLCYRSSMQNGLNVITVRVAMKNRIEIELLI